jgi:putative ABC transport system permease protein
VDIKKIKPEGGYENLSLMAIDPATYSQVTSFVFTSGQGDPQEMVARLDAGDAVFVSSVLSEKQGLKRGDRVQLLTRRGEREFEVAGVVVDFSNQGRVVQTSWNDLRRYWGINDASTFLVKLYPDRSPAAVRERIKSLYGNAYHLTVDSNQAIRERAMGLIGQTTGMFDVLALIAMIVAALGVVNTLTMNVVERTREIGMLRSLGMTRGQVMKMILAESGLMGVVGGVMGLALGLIMSRTVLSSMNNMAGFSLTYVFSVEGFVVGMIVAFVVSQLAALWPARRAARLRVIEAIQFE